MFTGKITVSVAASLVPAPDVGTVEAKIAEVFGNAFTDGTGANQAKQIFADKFTITGAGTQTYDLAGSLENAIGEAVVFTAIKAVILRNTGSAALTYGGGSNPFLGWLGDASDAIVIPAGGMVVLTDPTAGGQAVTAGTGDIVTIGGTDAAGTIIIIGETA